MRTNQGKFFLSLFVLSIPLLVQAGPWDDKVTQWRKESAFLKEAELPVLEKQAAQGDVRAIYLLYREIDNVRYGYKGSAGGSKVGALAQKLAETGNPIGMAALCSMHLDGKGGLIKDEAKAIRWCEKSASQGFGGAMQLVGWMYLNGRGVAKDDSEAVKWYRRGIEEGDGSSFVSLGMLYQEGRAGLTKDDSKAFELFKQGAEAGNAKAMSWVGWSYENGKGVAKDVKQSVQWFKKGADAGDSWAANELGKIYTNGRGVPKDVVEAAKWIKKGVEVGDRTSFMYLGQSYYLGTGMSQNYSEAMKYFKIAANLGEPDAMDSLGVGYAAGQGVQKDPVEGVKWFRRAAESGSSGGMFNLAVMYKDGQGVTKDDAESVKWYRKAAEGGDSRAMSNLGTMYLNGKGVPKDEAEAVKWYRKGAEAGNAVAMKNLAVMHENGQGVPKDEAEAAKWYTKGAEAGNGDAMSALGTMYASGKGIPKNTKEALAWYRKGADVGSSTAMVNLGWAYQEGTLLPKDETEAVRWYRKAAEIGDTDAMDRLGRAYRDSLGVAKDYAEALSWYRKSADLGNASAMASLATMYHLGYGVQLSVSDAVSWTQKGAEAGSGSAMVNLANMYRYGRGLPINYTEAARWYAKALQTNQKNTIFLDTGETADKRARRLLDEMVAKGQITDASVRQEVAAVFKPAPKAEWATLPSSTNTENTEIVLRLTDAGGGIGDIQLFIDGAIVDRNASRDFGVEASKDLTRRSFTVKLPEGRHDIKIRAYAAENIGNFTELTGSITSTWKKLSKPKLHLIAVGVNEFAEKDLNLKYAQADAKAVYDSLNKQIGGLYDKGETRLLLGRESAGKQAIINAIRAVQQNSQFDDVFVFYAASHGKNYESGGYYLLTSDVAAKAADKVKPSSLSYIELRDLFSQVKSRKKFVLLDTCHAGQSIKADDLVGTRGLKDDEQDLMDSLKQRSGATVLMAAELEQKAFEGYQGHGLFTYALLEAIGAAPANNSKLGNVRSTDEIMMHVESRVPQLAKEVFKAEQKTYASKAGAGFPLVKLGNP